MKPRVEKKIPRGVAMKCEKNDLLMKKEKKVDREMEQMWKCCENVGGMN